MQFTDEIKTLRLGYECYQFQENAALLDELDEVQVQLIIRKEERKFLLRKLCQYEPQTEAQVQAAARGVSTPANLQPMDGKRLKRRHNRETGRSG